MRLPTPMRRPIEPGPWPNDDVRRELGEAIRGLRRYHLLTQRDLEEVTGIDQTVISRLERGRHVHIRFYRLLSLLGAMGVVRISFRSRHPGASVAAWMSRRSVVPHSDVMRPPVEPRLFPADDELSELDDR
jgi:transcriptional regulator with XRE-family HTH domain